ncbi:hypothetical protein [Streptomyces sp. NPDC053560]|uniref:hypothetical protein n=1 Tax=Streptomyces sp. NPDC053560 TaxID=3365711 RepID=UPI0037D4ED9E
MSLGGRIRNAAFILVVLALLGLWLAAAFVDVHAQARHSLAVAIALGTGLFRLLFPPALRQPEVRAETDVVRRSAFVVFVGRVVVLAVWFAQVFMVGYGAYFVARGFQEQQPGFQARVALIALVGQVLALVSQCGRSMAGLRPDWGFSRSVLSILRFLLNRAFLICLAGYASVLPGLVEKALTWLPDHVYGFWTGLLPGWLAVPMTVVVCAAWFFAVLVAESVLQRLLAAALGQGNSLGEWLGSHAPITYRRNDTSVTFDFNYWLIRIYYFNSFQARAWLVRVLLEVHSSSNYPKYGRGPTTKQRRAWQAHQRPLTDEERQSLHDRIVTAMVAEAPPEWESLVLEYRAVVGHQEIQLAVDPSGDPFGWYGPEAEMNGDEEGGDYGGGGGEDGEGTSTTRQLPDFPERDALWRLREASYSVDRGAEYVQILAVTKDEAAERGRNGETRPWEVETWSWGGEHRPAWRTPPTARQYRRDLRRFPVARGRRPFWLRNEVKRIGWAE